MNYGKFFKLNLEESKVVDKVSVYDYMDLPAYFGNPKPMSPKYPISVCITQDALRFCLHYCVYHKKGTCQFLYTIDDKPGNIETIHMQEVFLEIPYANHSMLPIFDVIKELYINCFPIEPESSKDGDAFLPQLLRKRYYTTGNYNSNDEKQLFHSMRENIDKKLSYSSLWLMGLRKGEGYLDLKEEEKEKDKKEKQEDQRAYVGFMRKLLLDFMFDLKHSEVFQTSAFFQQMYSGLMSDFYFSALMHKCEYYYYRRLTLDAIYELEGENKSEKEEQDTRKKLIRKLYASQLFEAEKTWVEDITNPLAEQLFRPSDDDFETQETEPFCKRVKKVVHSILNTLFHRSDFVTRDDWFVGPEEELRRVCFTMVDKRSSGKEIKHMCNSEAIAEYLKVEKQDGIADLRSHISRWFLKRNDFADVLHLHLFKFAHDIVPFILIVLTGIILTCPGFFSQETWSNLPWIIGSVVIIWLCITGIAIYYWQKEPSFSDSHTEVLSDIRKRLVAKRMFWWMIVDGALLLLAIAAIYGNTNSLWTMICFIGSLVFLAVAIFITFIKNIAHIKLVKNVHLLLPRLVASIAAAWLTIAIGNELFQSFFDALPSWITCSILSGIVLFFILYEMNKIIPRESGGVKFLRSFEMLVISYLLSVVIGLFIINFTGERFLERSGYLETFHDEYLSEHDTPYQQDYYYIGAPLKDSTSMDYLKSLENLTVVREGHDQADNRPVVTYWDMHFWHDYHFFILRDFLIQFSFLAMFIGVFIQMIFEEKSITDM